MPAEDPAIRTVAVALAVVVRDGRVLICRRPPDVVLGNFWELPGGKQHSGETPESAATRELREETGLLATALGRLPSVTHDYPHARVRLTPVLCLSPTGDPQPLACQECRWISEQEIPEYKFPPANTMLSAWLRTAIVRTRCRFR